MQYDWIVAACLVASAAASAWYGLVLLQRPPTVRRAAVKAASILALACAVAYAGGGPVYAALVAALGCSALGDFLLALEKRWSLALGILAFLVAQLCYLTIFLGLYLLGREIAPLWLRHTMIALLLSAVVVFLLWLWREHPPGKPHPYILLAAALPASLLPLLVLPFLFALNADTLDQIPLLFWAALAGAVALFVLVVRLRPDLAMKAGVLPYVGAIAAMAALSFLADWTAWPAMLGAILFVISDGMIAGELFKLAPDAPARRVTRPAIWWTYYAAQLLLPLGIILAVRAA